MFEVPEGVTDGPLQVVELGGGISAAFGARLLADFGADVVKVEDRRAPDRSRLAGPFAGDVADSEASGLFMYLNRGKRGVAFDLGSSAGRARLLSLLSTADVVVENLGAAEFDRLLDGAALPERLVVCSISPYGQTGPKARYRGSELSAYASGGMLYMTGFQDRPPVKHGYHQAAHLAGVNAAAACLAAARLAHQTGRGERIDISEQETVAMTIFPALTVYSHTGGVVRRAPTDLPKLATSQAMRAADGWIMPSDAGLNVWWESFAAFIDCPELLEPQFATREARAPHEGDLDAIVAPAFEHRTRADLFHNGQEQGLTMSSIQDAAEVANCPQLAAREFFVDVVDREGVTVRMPGAVPATPGVNLQASRRPAPALGEHNDEVFGADSRAPVARGPASAQRAPGARLPLEGVRILELGMVFVLPLAITPLAALGADVIKVESASRPDSVRSGPMPRNVSRNDGYNVGGNFHLLNRNKRAITLDLTTVRGRELLLELIAKSDVVAENFTPRVLRNLGLTYERMREVNPRIILLSSTGFGQSGPWQNYKAYGPVTESVDGLMHVTGYKDGPPLRGGAGGFGVAFTDVAGAYYGTYSILAALERRERTGEGLWLDLSHYEAGVATLPEPMLDYTLNGRVAMRDGNRDTSLAPQGVYPCRDDDKWIAISVASARQFDALGRVLSIEWDAAKGYGSLEARRREHDAIDEMLAVATARFDARELEEALQAAGVDAAYVTSPRDVWLDAQLRWRGFAEAVAAPAYAPDVGTRVYPRPAWLMSNTPVTTRTSAPAFGEHTRAVLSEVLGMDEASIAALDEAGVIADSPRPGLIASRSLDLDGMLAAGRFIDVDDDFEARLLADPGGAS
ncbi:CoA transferase [bacterium]|nr:CoA transferase [bacterium]